MVYSDIELKDIYDRNIDMLYRIAYMFFKDKSKCEDVIQDIFLIVIKKKIKFEDLDHEKKWFIVAVKNKCKNVLKSKWNSEVEFDSNIEVVDSNKEDKIIDKVLELPPKYKIPIYLFYYENYEASEIANVLDTEVNTVYSWLNRGRKILKLKIEGDMNE